MDLNILLRRVAARILAEKGFVVEEQTGKGVRPGGRLLAKPKKGPAFLVSVRVGRDRSLGFSRLQDGRWRTLERVRFVLLIVPAKKKPNAYDLLAFKSMILRSWFDKALEAMKSAAMAPELDVPVFIALDETSKKNLGHDVVGLKKAALWSASISKKQIEDQSPSDDLEMLIEKVKLEFAKRNKVDVSQVSIELRVLA